MKAPPSVPISAFNSQLFSRWWSPGSLPYGTNVEDLLDPSHSSKPRNKLIAQVFYDLRLIERYGSGIQRILGECRAAGLPDPVFENFTGGFRVRFRMSNTDTARAETLSVEMVGAVSGGVDEGVKSLRLAIEQEPGNRLPFYADRLGVPVKSAERWLKSMRDSKTVVFRGAPKNGGYYLVP